VSHKAYHADFDRRKGHISPRTKACYVDPLPARDTIEDSNNGRARGTNTPAPLIFQVITLPRGDGNRNTRGAGDFDESFGRATTFERGMSARIVQRQLGGLRGIKDARAVLACLTAPSSATQSASVTRQTGAAAACVAQRFDSTPSG